MASKYDLLMSIHPNYVEKILSGEKKFELRKIQPYGRFDKIYIYSTSPVKKVVGEVRNVKIFVGPPETIWTVTKDANCVNKEDYDIYFKNSKTAVAFELNDILKYETPKELSDFGLTNPPQMFQYILEKE